MMLLERQGQGMGLGPASRLTLSSPRSQARTEAVYSPWFSQRKQRASEDNIVGGFWSEPDPFSPVSGMPH